ncbi:MAG: tetratricopeptide repeat protein [Cyanobacteriota bacterium]
MQLQDFSPAIDKLKAQLENDPDNIELLLQLAELYLKTEGDDYYNSVIILDRILELDPVNYAANRIRGLIYKELDNEEDALKCFETILKNYEHAKSHPEIKEIRFDYAETLENLERDEEALALFEQLLNENSKDIAVLFKLAHLYTVSEEYDKAISKYKFIMEIDPENEAALAQLVDLYEEIDKIQYHKMRAELFMKEGLVNKAIGEHKKLIPLLENPEDECAIHIKIANCYYAVDDYSHSLDEYNLALDLDSDNFEIYKGMGRVYFETEDYEEAIENFEKALTLNELGYDIHMDLADCYIELENYPEAIRELEIVKKHNPANLEVRCGLSEGYIAIRDLYKAKEELDFVLAREPENTRALGAMVDLNLEKEDYKAALEFSKSIVKLIPNSAFAARKLAEAYEALDDKYNAHYNFGLAYELKSEYGMAIDEYQAALEVNEKNAELLMKIGDLYILMGEKYIGIEYYENAADAEEDNAIPLKKLADFYLENNELDRATEAFARLVEIDKRNHEAVYNLAMLYEKQKYNEDALEAYEKFIQLAPNSTKADVVNKKIRKLKKKLGHEVEEDFEGDPDEYVDDRTVVQRLFDFFKR